MEDLVSHVVVKDQDGKVIIDETYNPSITKVNRHMFASSAKQGLETDADKQTTSTVQYSICVNDVYEG